MYSHTFFVTSVRGNDLAPQIAAKASLRLFFAKMPLPAFFMASAFFLALSDCAFLPILRKCPCRPSSWQARSSWHCPTAPSCHEEGRQGHFRKIGKKA